jgi:hypothetical protein
MDGSITSVNCTVSCSLSIYIYIQRICCEEQGQGQVIIGFLHLLWDTEEKLKWHW